MSGVVVGTALYWFCSISEVIRHLSDSFRRLLVTVFDDCSCLYRRAFDEAVKQLSRVSDPNIAQMLGVIRQREPLAIIMEYLSHGDLHQFLQQRVFDDASDRMHRNGPPSLR